MFGEKSHVDKNFDRWTTANSGYTKIAQVSVWAWTGGMKGMAHLFASSAAPLNYKVTSATGSFTLQDLRYQAWGSSHTGVINFAFCDGSVKPVADTVSQDTVRRLSTRAPGLGVSPALEVVSNYD